MKHRLYYSIIFVALLLTASVSSAEVISLNGTWEVGENRTYSRKMIIPGLASDPAQMNDATLWFRREITLPGGDWTQATLILKGALFGPSVYINGQKVSGQNGGLAPTFHPLAHEAVKPNSTVTLEIALKSLKNMSESDASYVPLDNHWRSNLSSLIWDDVLLETHGDFRIQRVIPFSDLKKDLVKVSFEIEDRSDGKRMPDQILCEIFNRSGKCIAKDQQKTGSLKGEIIVRFHGKCKPWTPDDPNLYKMKLTLFQAKKILDTEILSYGLKDFSVKGIGFVLNGNPCELRAGTVVWHRWIRDPEARYIAFDEDWFLKNILLRLKDHGANTLRFHLGNPPESFIDLCDRYGLLVQYEWSFFDGMPASEESLLEQWRSWLDLAMRHPSVALIHPYNETTGDVLKTAWSALNRLVEEYPPLVLEERDVIHVHKYWWSMFENVGLYYDSAEEFPKPVMADEFGGNYLDGYGVPGGYRALPETFLRFCGGGHTPAMRMNHHTISNSQIAEYWRRIGAAGFSPFCIVGSWEDGNHWYLGRLKNGYPKDVWDALTAAYSPVSVSLEIWDRNFTPAQKIEIPLYLYNDTGSKTALDVRISVEGGDERPLAEKVIHQPLDAYSWKVQKITLDLPEEPGRYTVKALLLNPPAAVKYPVVSRWDFQILRAVVAEKVKTRKIGIMEDEKELSAFLSSQGLTACSSDDREYDVLLGSRKTYEQMVEDKRLRDKMYRIVQSGKSILLLDIGPQDLGQGYSEDPDMKYGFLQSRRKVLNPEITELGLFGGVQLTFTTVPEPESHIHPSREKTDLWFNLEKDNTWLWNGMRGGLIVPATDMKFYGLSQEALVSQWKSRGADEKRFETGRYFAYDLEGFYAYSSREKDKAVMQSLRERVRSLMEKDPAMSITIDPDAEIQISDLAELYGKSSSAEAGKITPLVNCGNDLLRSPVIQIDFGAGRGSVILSQLLTEGRLARDFGQEGLYGRRYDEAAVQFVLNLLNRL